MQGDKCGHLTISLLVITAWNRAQTIFWDRISLCFLGTLFARLLIGYFDRVQMWQSFTALASTGSKNAFGRKGISTVILYGLKSVSSWSLVEKVPCSCFSGLLGLIISCFLFLHVKLNEAICFVRFCHCFGRQWPTSSSTPQSYWKPSKHL